MQVLTPSQSASIAAGIYNLSEFSVAEAQRRALVLGSEGLFAVDDSSRFTGTSGTLMFKRTTGFGYIAAGLGNRQGEVLIATRGTDLLADWLTDANFAVQRGPSGLAVHAGFNEVWQTYIADVRSFLRGRNPATIHCVGHSLGGALAALNADYLTSIGAGAVKLYTFGAPRVGLRAFSQRLTQRVGETSIYRVAHMADPVPMIPVYPFAHAAWSGAHIRLVSGGALISPAAHKMGSYVPLVAEASWDALLVASRPAANEDAEMATWLQSASAGGGIALYSARLLSMIGRALRWLLKSAGQAVGTQLMIGATVIDRIAWLLTQGARATVAIANGVRQLISAVFLFLGRTIASGVEITVAFLRWTLDLLFGAISGLGMRAIDAVRAR